MAKFVQVIIDTIQLGTVSIEYSLKLRQANMAAAAIVAIRKKVGHSTRRSESDEKHDLFGKLPSRESRELDIELGMLLLG